MIPANLDHLRKTVAGALTPTWETFVAEDGHVSARMKSTDELAAAVLASLAPVFEQREAQAREQGRAEGIEQAVARLDAMVREARSFNNREYKRLAEAFDLVADDVRRSLLPADRQEDRSE